MSIYIRAKDETGQWRYAKVKTGRGIRTSGLKGPFHLRYTTGEGKQSWWPDKPETFEEAVELDSKIDSMVAAKQQGLTIAEYEDRTNANRVPIKAAAAAFLEQKKSKCLIFAGSLVSSRYRFALPTLASHTRIQSLEPDKSTGSRSHSRFALRKGLIGSWPGSLKG